jgi:uncharacterized protein YggE
MAYYQDTDTIAVKATGVANTRFVSASFKAHLTTYAKTGPAAKEAAKDLVASIWAVLNDHTDRARIDREKIRTTFEVDVHTTHDPQMRAMVNTGYKATYSIQFKALNVDAAIDVHDALTSLEGISAPTPIFNADVSPKIYGAAFEDAFTKAQAQFKYQCEVTGQKLEHFVLQSWSTEQEQAVGKTLSVSNKAPDLKVSLEPGHATMEMNVTFVYRHKTAEEKAAKPCS